MSLDLPGRYWPYEETEISANPECSEITISAPWCEALIKANPSSFPRLYQAAQWWEEIVKKAKKSDTPRNFGEPESSSRPGSIEKSSLAEPLCAENLQNLSELLRLVKKYPVAYLLPRADLNSDGAKVEQEADLGKTPHLLITKFSGQFKDRGLAFLNSDWPDWLWDQSSALSIALYARETAAYDPQTLLTVGHRFHLLDTIENNQTSELYSFIRQRQESAEDAKRACAFVVRQNHYVTFQCEQALKPARKICGAARSILDAFIQSERGHERLFERALDALGFRYDEIPVTEVNQTLMDFFEYVASRNFLGFCLMLAMFERSSYQKVDPLAALLKHCGFSEAAREVEIHAEINEKGGHECVALSLLETMGPVSRGYAIEALSLAEVGSYLFTRFSASILSPLLKENFAGRAVFF